MAGTPDDLASPQVERLTHPGEHAIGGSNGWDDPLPADEPVVVHRPDPRPSPDVPTDVVTVAELHREVDELRDQLEVAFNEVMLKLTKLDLRLTTIQTRVRRPTGQEDPAAEAAELDLVEQVVELTGVVHQQREVLAQVQGAVGDLQRRLGPA